MIYSPFNLPFQHSLGIELTLRTLHIAILAQGDLFRNFCPLIFYPLPRTFLSPSLLKICPIPYASALYFVFLDFMSLECYLYVVCMDKYVSTWILGQQYGQCIGGAVSPFPGRFGTWHRFHSGPGIARLSSTYPGMCFIFASFFVDFLGIHLVFIIAPDVRRICRIFGIYPAWWYGYPE